MARIYTGVCGWNYDDWRGLFYPEGVAKRRHLEYLSTQLTSVETNGTFYSLQKPSTFENWYQQTSRGFRFALKGPRLITGMKRLKDVYVPLANFFASGPLDLEEKLGPVLWQLPGAMAYNADRLETFLGMLPRNTQQAAALAKDHDEHLKSEPAFGSGTHRRIRHAIEFRHESWFCDACVEQLQRHGVALVFSDSPGSWPYYEDITAGFVYLRLHGDKELYNSNYQPQVLNQWAKRLRAWMGGRQPEDARLCSSHHPPKRNARDAYVYLDNTDAGRAPINAQTLAQSLT